MKVASIVWMLLALALLYILLVATIADDGTIMIGCSNVVQTRGGTICLDKAYRR